MHTALHELTHVFGGMNPVFDTTNASNSMFLNRGQIVNPRGNVYIQEYDPAYGRTVSKIMSPRVLNLTREAFGCPNATGLPLEDVELGKGAHWEARVTGPELMCVGHAVETGDSGRLCFTLALPLLPSGGGAKPCGIADTSVCPPGVTGRVCMPPSTSLRACLLFSLFACRSYGSGSGQVYISDFTFAYLQDTDQYLVNKTMGGKLSPDVVDQFVSAGVSLGTADSTDTYTPPAPKTPGYPTWGRGEGCAFLDGHPKTSWPARYTCAQNQNYGCTAGASQRRLGERVDGLATSSGGLARSDCVPTPRRLYRFLACMFQLPGLSLVPPPLSLSLSRSADYRMSAVCIVKGDYSSEPACASNYVNQGTGSTVCGTNNDACSGGSCGIASAFRWFGSNSAAQAASGVSAATVATTGGFSSSMDYVPVQVGYWACNTDNPTTNVSAGVDGTGTGLDNFANLFGVSTDMSMFGGQARCPNCRCLQSSLLEFSRSLTPSTASYGLCYRSNCYRPDYLQVAIRGQFSKNVAYWYKCPPEGGKIYVVGFTGALSCPPAKDFCTMETVTGIKYPEQSFVYEAIFWGIIVGGALLLSLVCLAPCCRDKLITCCKRGCGALQFETDYEEEEVVMANGKTLRRLRIVSRRGVSAPPKRSSKDSDGKETRADRLPSSCASWTLLSINTVTMMAGLTMLGLVIYAIYTAKLFSLGIPLLGVACLVVMVSFIGLWAARKRAERGPSCWLLTYFFANLLLLVLLVWTIAYNLGFSNWKSVFEQNWDSISDYIPAKYKAGTTTQAQMASAEDAIQSNLYALGGIAIAVVVVYVTALAASGRLIHASTLASMTLAICNNSLIACGILFSVVGFYLLAANGRAANLIIVVATVIVAGLYALLLGIVGTLAVFKKRKWLLAVYGVLVTMLIGFFAYCIWLFFTQSAKVTNYVNGLSDADLAKVASDLGFSLSKAQIINKLQDNMNQLGITAAICTGVAVVLLVAIVVYYRMVRQEQVDSQNSAGVQTLADVERVEAAAAGASAARQKMQQKEVAAQQQRAVAVPVPVALAASAPVAGPAGIARAPVESDPRNVGQQQMQYQQQFTGPVPSPAGFVGPNPMTAPRSTAAAGGGMMPGGPAYAIPMGAPGYPQYAVGGVGGPAGVYGQGMYQQRPQGAIPPGLAQYNRMAGQASVRGGPIRGAAAGPGGGQTADL